LDQLRTESRNLHIELFTAILAPSGECRQSARGEVRCLAPLVTHLFSLHEISYHICGCNFSVSQPNAVYIEVTGIDNDNGNEGKHQYFFKTNTSLTYCSFQSVDIAGTIGLCGFVLWLFFWAIYAA